MIASKNPCSDVTRPRAAPVAQHHSPHPCELTISISPLRAPCSAVGPQKMLGCGAPIEEPRAQLSPLLTARLCGPSRRAVSASPGRRIPRPRPHCTRASMPRARQVGRWAHQRHGDGWHFAYLAHRRHGGSEQSVHSPPTASMPDGSAARKLTPAGSARAAAHRSWRSRSGRRAGHSKNGFPLPPRCLGASIGATASDRPVAE